MQRRIAGDVIGTADLIGVAVDGADAHAQVFQVRTGCSPNARASISTTAPSATRRR